MNTAFSRSRYCVVALVLSVYTSQAFGQTQWEVERVLLAPEATQTKASSWGFGAPLGSSSRSKQKQVLFSGGTNDLNGTSYSHIFSGGSRGPELEVDLHFTSDFELFTLWWHPGFALLKTPTGFQAAARELPWFLTRLDFPSGNILERKKPPLPGIGEAQQSQWTAIWNAGDINRDGFDDLFFQAHTIGVQHSYTGLIDGATWSVIWRHYGVGSQAVYPIYPDPTNGFSDLNGDGISDFVAGFLYKLPSSSVFSRQVIAFSGIDGSIIWERILPDTGLDPGIWGKDINGDSVPDVITQASAHKIYALDGTSGATLWISDIFAAVPLIPGGGTSPRFANPVFFESGVENGTVSTVSSVIEIRPPGASDDIQFILTINAADGVPLLVSSFPSDLKPWLPDRIGPAPHPTSFLLGDIDNDGFTEIGSGIPTPSQDPNAWWAFGVVSSFAIFGPPTITLPATLPLTQSHTAAFEIPSAPFMDLQLIMSNEFMPRNGFELDHWTTNLATGSLLNWSRGRNLRTTLDQDGKGSISFILPTKPGLIGSELYFRGIVWDVAAGPGKVWTISSLGKATVSP